MDLLDLIASRRSVRRYAERPVPEEAVRSCLEAARLAPSAENSQPWRFVVLQNPEAIREFGRRAFSGIYLPTSFASRAPVLVALLAKPDLLANGLGRAVRRVAFYQTDLGIAGEHLVLRAQELGLGTCWIGWFDEKAARRFLAIPPTYRIPCLIALGYPAEPLPPPRPRIPLDELILRWIR